MEDVISTFDSHLKLINEDPYKKLTGRHVIFNKVKHDFGQIVEILIGGNPREHELKVIYSFGVYLQKEIWNELESLNKKKIYSPIGNKIYESERILYSVCLDHFLTFGIKNNNDYNDMIMYPSKNTKIIYSKGDRVKRIKSTPLPPLEGKCEVTGKVGDEGIIIFFDKSKEWPPNSGRVIPDMYVVQFNDGTVLGVPTDDVKIIKSNSSESYIPPCEEEDEDEEVTEDDQPKNRKILLDDEISIGMRVWIESSDSNVPHEGIGGIIKKHFKYTGSDSGCGYETRIDLDNGSDVRSSIFNNYWVRIYHY